MTTNNKHINIKSDDIIDQSIRNYQIQYSVSKNDALNNLLQKIDQQKPFQKKSSKIRQLYLGVASAAAVLILFFFSLPQNKMEVAGKHGFSTIMMLPDNSRVILNDLSSITYKERFGQRYVKLSGDAYFEVKKGDKFTVKTNNGNIEVLGTRFEVDESVNTMNVTCFEGSVKVNSNKRETILSANEMAIASSIKLEKKAISNISFPEYAFFRRKFVETDVNEVIDAIELFFGIDVEIDKASSRKFTGEFVTTNYKESLDILCLSMDMKYSKTGNDIYLIK